MPIDTTFILNNFIAFLILVLMVFIAIATVLFILLVTYLEQWDIYYPAIDRWLKARKKAKVERERKEKKRAGKLARKEKNDGQV